MYQPDFPPVPFRSGLYPVVDSVQWIERLLDAGVRTLQLRIKDRRDEEVEADVVAAIALGRRYNARLFINDYWRLAIKHQAYGVHFQARFASHRRSECHPRGRPAAGRFDT
ncbi:thiamine phosphate synthase [Escherichia coli]